MRFDELLTELGKNIGLEDLAFDANGSCSVFLDDDEVFFELSDGRLLIISPIGPVSGREGLFRAVLEGNFLGGQSAFGSIGINSDQNEFVLSRVLEGDVPYLDFEKSLLVFIRCLRKWKNIVRDARMPDDVQETAKAENGNWLSV